MHCSQKGLSGLSDNAPQREVLLVTRGKERDGQVGGGGGGEGGDRR